LQIFWQKKKKSEFCNVEMAKQGILEVPSGGSGGSGAKMCVHAFFLFFIWSGQKKAVILQAFL